MNTVNNQRRKASKETIERTFIQLMQTKDVNEITVTELCKIANFNRSTFYANYLDVYDLVDKIKDKMFHDFQTLYADELTNNYNSNDYLRLFIHIKENQLFYRAYFKLDFPGNIKVSGYSREQAEKYYQNQHIPYHMEFFRGGITSIIKLWLEHGCDLSPQEMDTILKDEYKNKHDI